MKVNKIKDWNEWMNDSSSSSFFFIGLTSVFFSCKHGFEGYFTTAARVVNHPLPTHWWRATLPFSKNNSFICLKWGCEVIELQMGRMVQRSLRSRNVYSRMPFLSSTQAAHPTVIDWINEKNMQCMNKIINTWHVIIYNPLSFLNQNK